MKIDDILYVGALLLAACLPRVTAQSPTESSKPELVQYKPGQVWTMEQGIVGRLWGIDQDITVTVLAIEDVHRVGRVIHVRVDKIPWQACGDIHLTRAIEHLAITEKMMRKSGLVLSNDNVVLPESSIEASRKWEVGKTHEVAKMPLQKAIWGQGATAGPMICNVVPSQT